MSKAIEEGDRVDHRIFGFGTVTAVQGDKIEIDFDDKPGDIKRVLASFLKKVASAQTRPFKYWDRKWQELRTAWLAARRAHEAELASFRPLPDDRKLTALRNNEDLAWAAVQAFLAEEKEGLHL
ncbi:hypothetical protein [Novosphingobium humi]|uniref:hypothetical protein n=1 Tax=Novosphingobium humi TaxID=2282397 RepID=UPI0025B1A2A0|nr:hypothetical protein [Novosphingobium humi]WJS97226.1 hypothetical protein NYQ05_08580 [Novosphingobium humi]